MGNGIYIALSGAKAQTRALDVVANNVANANTVGFRAERMSFGEALGRAQSPDSMYAQVKGGGTDVSAGVVQKTGNPLDLALVGDGYFAVQTGRGVRYTRAGNFRLDAQGVLVSATNDPALSVEGSTIKVPEGSASVTVGQDGTVSADGTEIGTLRISRLAPNVATRDGNNMFDANGSATDVDGSVQVRSGELEKSNVNIVRGMVDLVKTSRSYESLLRMIENYRQIDSRTARSIGTPK